MASLIKIGKFVKFYTHYVVIINQYRELCEGETKRSCTLAYKRIPMGTVFHTHVLVLENIERNV